MSLAAVQRHDSKPVKGNHSILFDGYKIILGGLEPERNPVVQAKAQAS